MKKIIFKKYDGSIKYGEGSVTHAAQKIKSNIIVVRFYVTSKF